MSKKRYIFTIDDDCFVASKPTGERINALQQHIRNLLTPSTPHFFNTLYDPYVEGSDFVRGYPFSMRDGVPTAISHGLCKSRCACMTPCPLLQQPTSNYACAKVRQTWHSISACCNTRSACAVLPSWCSLELVCQRPS